MKSRSPLFVFEYFSRSNPVYKTTVRLEIPSDQEHSPHSVFFRPSTITMADVAAMAMAMAVDSLHNSAPTPQSVHNSAATLPSSAATLQSDARMSDAMFGAPNGHNALSAMFGGGPQPAMQQPDVSAPPLPAIAVAVPRQQIASAQPAKVAAVATAVGWTAGQARVSAAAAAASRALTTTTQPTRPQQPPPARQQTPNSTKKGKQQQQQQAEAELTEAEIKKENEYLSQVAVQDLHKHSKTRAALVAANIRAHVNPYGYQLEALTWLMSRETLAAKTRDESGGRSGGIVAMAMGLGKTLITLCWIALSYMVECGILGEQPQPSLILAPKSVASNWLFVAHLRLPLRLHCVCPCVCIASAPASAVRMHLREHGV